MISVRLREGAAWDEIALTSSSASMLGASGVVTVTPGARAGLWRVRDNGYVGAARVGRGDDAVDVRIQPKTTIDRLFFLLGYAGRHRGWRREEVDAGEAPDLVPALAHAFARAAERALRQGVLLGYRETEEALPVVRGRIREAEQVRRRYGLPLPVEVRYDDYTIDIAENQLLLTATEHLLRLPGVTVETRKMLRRLLVRLVGVGRLVAGRALPRWEPSRLNTRYHTALGLADLVLRGASYELDDGTTVKVDGLLLEMWRIFEDFVTVALTDALRPYGGRSQPQDMRHHLDHARHVQLKPDLVHYQLTPEGRDRPGAVVDAKYKIERGPGGFNPDMYQMLAYCTVLGLDRGHLVYAEGSALPRVHRVHGTDLAIVQHSLDLSLPPDALLAQVAALAANIA